jgi:tRNA (guanine37-N1)-methyltransferase
MFNQRVSQELAKLERVVLLCGRYEGVDERVAENLADQEISIGDYILSGGEMAAAIMVDAITRLVPGALGNAASAQQESFTAGAAKGALDGCDLPDSTCASGGLLDYPHYTRPAEFRGSAVPEVLIGGNHEQIRKWRRKKALEKTLRNRPDLLEKQPLSAEDKKFLKEISNC